MKSIFKKMIAATACVSMMAAGSALNVSAATGVYFNLDDEVECLAGDENVKVQLFTTESDAQFDTLSLMLNYDPALKFVSAKSLVGMGEAFNARNNTPTSQVFLQMAISDAPKVIGNDKVALIELTFSVPEDTAPGLYPIKWAEEGGYSFSIKDSTTSGTKDLDHTYDEQGSILVLAPPVTTTTPTPTTTVTTTTTPTPTTTVTTTTTAAPATTVTKATGTAAATKSTTKVTSAPVTGNDSKGIAALAATMVAAAGAAIVIKKKKD